MIYTFSDEYKDFELRYRNYQDGHNAESLNMESQPGILRVERPLFDEHYLLDPVDAEQLWNTIQEIQCMLFHPLRLILGWSQFLKKYCQ